MRIPFDHPLHDFEEVPHLAFSVSATGKPSAVFVCRICGTMGTRTADSRWLHVQDSRPKARSRAEHCSAEVARQGSRLVLIVAEDMSERGQEYAALRTGCAYAAPPDRNRDLSEGVWVRTAGGDVMILPDDYAILRVRKRHRRA